MKDNEDQQPTRDRLTEMIAQAKARGVNVLIVFNETQPLLDEVILLRPNSPGFEKARSPFDILDKRL